MRFGRFKFGSIQIDGVTYEYDVVIDRGSIRKRKKKPSKPFHNAYGHTPLSAAEDIPWHCTQALYAGELLAGSNSSWIPTDVAGVLLGIQYVQRCSADGPPSSTRTSSI